MSSYYDKSNSAPLPLAAGLTVLKKPAYQNVRSFVFHESYLAQTFQVKSAGLALELELILSPQLSPCTAAKQSATPTAIHLRRPLSFSVHLLPRPR